MLKTFSTCVYAVSAAYATVGLLACVALLILLSIRRSDFSDGERKVLRYLEAYVLPYIAIYVIIGFVCVITFFANCVIKYL